MKKLFFTALLACITFQGFATTFVVYVTATNFLPDTLRDVHPGDVITWVWRDGLQTTSSSAIPKNAPSWNAEISVGNSEFSYTVPNIEGAYNYRSNYNPTGITGVFLVSNATGVNTTTKITSVSCSPNPASGKLHLNFESNSGITDISLCDITGRAIISNRYAAKEADIDVSALAGGVYFLKAKEEDGSMSIQRVEIRH